MYFHKSFISESFYSIWDMYNTIQTSSSSINTYFIY